MLKNGRVFFSERKNRNKMNKIIYLNVTSIVQKKITEQTPTCYLTDPSTVWLRSESPPYARVSDTAVKQYDQNQRGEFVVEVNITRNVEEIQQYFRIVEVAIDLVAIQSAAAETENGQG